MTIVASVIRAISEGTVRWRLMSVCLVLVRTEGHALTLLTGTAVTARLTLRYVVHALHCNIFNHNHALHTPVPGCQL